MRGRLDDAREQRFAEAALVRLVDERPSDSTGCCKDEEVHQGESLHVLRWRSRVVTQAGVGGKRT